MSNQTRKSILIAGLGSNADPKSYPVDKFEEILTTQLKKLDEAGFYAEHISLNPNDLQHSLDKLQKTLESRDWDGFEIGFAVRGNSEITEIFEKAVNVFVEVKPGRKLMFPRTPDEISVAPVRCFLGGKWD